MILRSIYLLFFTCLNFGLLAQEVPTDIRDQLESYIDEEVDDLDLQFLMDQLEYYLKKPLNINKVSFQELQSLRLLNDLQIGDIIDHRQRYGDFIALEELQSIASFGIEDIRRIQYFIAVNDPDKFSMPIPKMMSQARDEVFFKVSRFLEAKKGFQENSEGEKPYLGDPYNLFVRYRANFENRLRFGFTLEKDAGEKFREFSEYGGFDFGTIHFYLKDYNQTIKEIAIGDYTVSMGQGLISHNSFGAGKSALVSNVVRGGRIFRPFNSVNENGFLRGGALRIQLSPSVDLSVFASRVSRDGNIIEQDTIDGLEERGLLISSLQTTGNHRTESELFDRHSVSLNSLGGILKYRLRKGHVAFNVQQHNFDKTIQRAENLYNQFRFSGDIITNCSIDFSYRLRNYSFFGESAYSNTGGLAHLYGALVGLSRRLSMAVLFRKYDKDYNALNPNAFGESSTINNEQGIYLGLDFRLSRKWSIRTYADFWKHPWLRQNISRPSLGQEYLLRLDYYEKRKLRIYVQFTYEDKLQDYAADHKLNATGFQKRYKARFHFSNQLNKSLELRTRFELSRFENPVKVSEGYLIYQDFIYSTMDSPISFTARVALFETDDFDSRIFAFENSVLYEYSIPSYFNRGFRYYLNFRYDIAPYLTYELRWARTHLTNQDSFSSGNEEILGDLKTEFKMQLRCQF